MSRTSTQPPAESLAHVYLTTAEACSIARCCRRTLHRWVEDGLIESTRPVAAGSGRRLIVRRSLERFLAGEQVTS